jgi:hypothetical protein
MNHYFIRAFADIIRTNMKKIKFEAILTYDNNIMHGKDKEAIEWLYKVVLKDTLVLHSNETGDEIGTVKITRIIK